MYKWEYSMEKSRIQTHVCNYAKNGREKKTRRNTYDYQFGKGDKLISIFVNFLNFSCMLWGCLILILKIILIRWLFE